MIPLQTPLDRTDTSQEIVSKTYGFNSDMLSGEARYVRLNVKSATLQNNPTNNWYTPTIYECKIYGERTGVRKMPSPAAAFDFEDGTAKDTSGNNISLTLHGNAKVSSDSQKGNVLTLDGMTDSYAMEKYGELFIPFAWTVK